MKIMLFSDIHLGIESNNEDRLNDALSAVDMMCTKAKEENITTCIFLGDFINDKKNLNIYVYNILSEIIKKLLNTFTNKIYFILGNHDVYYKEAKDTDVIHGLKLLENLSLEQIDIISRITEISLYNKKCLLIPFINNQAYKAELANYQNNKYDYIFTHHPFNNSLYIKYNKVDNDIFLNNELEISLSDKILFDNVTNNINNVSLQYDSFDLSDIRKLLNNSGIAFAGHIHTKKEINISENNQKLMFIGSILPHTFNDTNNKEFGYYILNTDNNNIQFFNTSNILSFIKINFNDFIKLLNFKYSDICIEKLDILANKLAEYIEKRFMSNTNKIYIRIFFSELYYKLSNNDIKFILLNKVKENLNNKNVIMDYDFELNNDNLILDEISGSAEQINNLSDNFDTKIIDTFFNKIPENILNNNGLDINIAKQMFYDYLKKIDGE